MEISMVDVDKGVDELFDVELAAHRADMPDQPDPGAFAFGVSIANPWPGMESHRRLARIDGRMVGHGTVSLPIFDNLHTASVSIVVHPEFRRRGIGRLLATELIEIARAKGRRVVTGQTVGPLDGGPARPDAGPRFLEAMDFKLALTDIHRQVDLTGIDLDVERRLYDEALQKSLAEYETVSWQRRLPDELAADVAKINATFFLEAPAGELELEAENLDARRVLDYEDAMDLRGTFRIGAIARHIASGEIVANTVIGVPRDPGDHAEQWITIVSRGHRGHRLGMRIKIENLRQLRTAKPEVRWIHTGNADVNDHMIAINDALGFRTVDAWPEYQRDL